MLHLGMAGEYRMEVRRNNELVKDTGWFKNLVLNSGLDRFGTASANAQIYYCRVGTGSSNPVETQSSLDSQIAFSTSTGSSSVTNAGAPNYQNNIVTAYTFNQGAVVGNITEVGIGWTTNTSNTLFSRALILDTNGNPTAITLTAIDQLTVYYRLTLYPKLTDSTGSFLINGITYNYTARAANIGSFGNSSDIFTQGMMTAPGGWSTYRASPTMPTLGAITGYPNGTSANNWAWNFGTQNVGYAVGQSSYVVGSYYLDHTWYAGIGGMNESGGIGGFFIYYRGAVQFQIVFNQPIPKDNTKTFNFTTRISWGRY